MPDVLGFPLPLAQERLHSSGFEIGTVTYTFSPKQEEKKSPRVVRQHMTSTNKVNLVVANSPWASLTT